MVGKARPRAFLSPQENAMPLFSLFDFSQLIQQLMVRPAYGWEPDPTDERDGDFEFGATPAATNRPRSCSEIDNSHFFKPTSNQLHLPSCSPNAGADLFEAVDIQHKYLTYMAKGMSHEKALAAAQAEVNDLSRLFLWWNARNAMDPPMHKNDESGTYNRLVMDVASRFGVCIESTWPYNEDRLPPRYEPRTIVRPSLSAYRNARGHMTSSYHSILSDGYCRLERIIQALHATPGVLFGTVLGPDFPRATSEVLRIPKEKKGRHAMVIVGYSRAKQAFKVRNSWGRQFGAGGYCWLHEDYIAWRNSRSFWVCTKGVLS